MPLITSHHRRIPHFVIRSGGARGQQGAGTKERERERERERQGFGVCLGMIFRLACCYFGTGFGVLGKMLGSHEGILWGILGRGGMGREGEGGRGFFGGVGSMRRRASIDCFNGGAVGDVIGVLYSVDN